MAGIIALFMNIYILYDALHYFHRSSNFQEIIVRIIPLLEVCCLMNLLVHLH